MTPKTKKIVIWSAVIGVIAIGSYIGYAAWKKKQEEEAANKPKISAADAQAIGTGVGSFIKSLFSKAPVVAPAPANSTSGLNYPIA